MQKVAIIPARGGSKRIPRKNIREFNDVPMIARTIRFLNEMDFFDAVVVSTDDQDIYDISVSEGATVPFLRSTNLSDDFTPTVPVIADALKKLETLGFDYEFCCCIYPCTPFLVKEDIVKAFDLLVSAKSDFTYSVCQYRHPTQRRLRMQETAQMEFLEPENALVRTQDLETLFHDAGQFYWGTRRAWKSEKKMHTAGLGFEIPAWRVIDIDTEDDWQRAELLHNSFKNM